MFKKYLIVIFLCTVFLSPNVQAQDIYGIFFCPSIGARFPYGEETLKYKVGFSFGGSFEYGTSAIPFFIKSEFIYANFPQNDFVDNAYHQKSIYGITIGVDYLFYPIFASETVLIPYISFELSYNFIQRTFTSYTTQFEAKTINESKLGFNFGFGLSIFLIDFTLKYHYLTYEPYIGINYRLRLPIYVSL